MANIFDLFKKIENERTKSNEKQGPVEFIIAGLGNPGPKYEGTRHNVGFMTLSYLEQKESIKIKKIKFKSLVCDTDFCGHRTLFMLPQTLMNLSGQAVSEAASFYKIPPENIIIINDDISLPVGKMRIRTHGSDGGHNGLKNIIYLLNSDKFTRIKIGVGEPIDKDQMINWVLGKIPEEDQKELYSTIENAYEALKLIVLGKTSEAMQKFN